MIQYETYKSGQLFGIRYRFDTAGDALPEHAHEPWALHNIIVLKGSCVFECDGIRRVLHCGDVFDFDGRRMHRISACERAEVIHLFLNGEPAHYVGLPASELSGSIAT